MNGAKILVTGPTGQVGLPVAKALAADNEVWAIARFTDRAGREQLEGAGVRCEAVDLLSGDFSSLPDDFTYVLHFAVSKAGTWDADLDGNAASVGFLMEHCRKATAFLHCSSAAVYQPNGHHAFIEDDPLGDNHRVYEGFLPFMQTYSISKIAAEAMARYASRRWNVPTTIARLSVPYGDNGGWPAIHLDMKLGGMPVPVHPNAPSRYNPIHEDDMVAMIPGLLAIASVPPTVVNWGGEAATIEGWCALLGDITGLELETVTTDQTLESVTLDTSRSQKLVGSTKVDLRDGLQRMVATRHPELLR